MYIKLVSPDKSESQLWAALGGYGPTWGKVNTLDELDLDGFGENVIRFWADMGPFRWIEFIPTGSFDVHLAYTSGDIYVQDASGQTVDRVN